MQALKTSQCGDYLFEIVNAEKVRVEISRDRLARVKDKNSVYSGYSYLVPLYEEDISVKPVSRFVYYAFPSNSLSLDTVRVNMGKSNIDEERATREKVIRGLISLYYLVSEGKIYNVPINPLNYVYTKDNKVMGFYREDEELGEITDEWLMEFKKLIAFYLVTDSSIIPERFNDYTIQDLIGYMTDGVHRGFKLIYSCMSLGEMVDLYVTERSEVKALQNFFKLSPTFNQPVDLTSEIPLTIESVEVNTVPDQKKGKGKAREKAVDPVKEDKQKARIKKQRRADEEKNARKKSKKAYEPNEAKRKALEYDEKMARKKKQKPLILLFVILVLGFGVYFLYDRLTDNSAQGNEDFTQVYSQLQQIVSPEE